MSDRARASHILVASKGEASTLRSAISSHKDFQRFARKRSTCPSGRKGGDLGWFNRGQMVPAFEEVVWGATLNEVSDPVQTEFGYHLIWVHERE